jgi:hypothetical protein
MKIISCGDIHGKSVWKQIDPKKYDKIIFVGDYVDDYPPTTDEQILGNLLDIIEFKKANMEKVELLWGNHELSYTLGDICTGYRPSMSRTLPVIFSQNKKLFKYAHQIGNHIWTHAGILSVWHEGFQQALTKIKENQGIDLLGMRLADQINAIADTSFRNILLDIGSIRGGFQECGGPLWADKSEFGYFGLPKGFHQIVGHSKVENPYENKYNIRGENESITFIDCLDTVTEFYEVEI